MGYTMKKVTGMMNCLRGRALKKYPNKRPRAIDIGIDQTRLRCRAERIFHMLRLL
jgi:hypothetical protein